MPAKPTIPNAKKLPPPTGDLDEIQQHEIRAAFPHNFKTIGVGGKPSSYLPPTSLKEVTGLPTPVETRVTPGIGAAGPSGRKSVAWKAVICKDENASMAPLKNMQMASVTDVPCSKTSLGLKKPNRFAATVGPRGPQGIAVEVDAGESMFGMTKKRMSNLGGPPMAPRSTRWAANVRTAPGKQITAREETFKTGKVLKNKKKVVI